MPYTEAGMFYPHAIGGINEEGYWAVVGVKVDESGNPVSDGGTTGWRTGTKEYCEREYKYLCLLDEDEVENADKDRYAGKDGFAFINGEWWFLEIKFITSEEQTIEQCNYWVDACEGETSYWRYPPSGGESSPPDLPEGFEVVPEESFDYWVIKRSAEMGKPAASAA